MEVAASENQLSCYVLKYKTGNLWALSQKTIDSKLLKKDFGMQFPNPGTALEVSTM